MRILLRKKKEAIFTEFGKGRKVRCPITRRILVRGKTRKTIQAFRCIFQECRNLKLHRPEMYYHVFMSLYM